MNFWQVLALLIFSNLLILSSVYSGFYFGWMARRGSPPVSMPIISTIVDSFAKKDREKEEEPRGFYD